MNPYSAEAIGDIIFAYLLIILPERCLHPRGLDVTGCYN